MQGFSLLCLATASVVFGQTYTISTFAGGGLGDNVPGRSYALDAVAIASDAAGDIFIANRASVFRLDAAEGTLSRVAGNGVFGSSGDGGPATSAELDTPSGLALDAFGNLYISTLFDNRVRKVSNGIITTVAGNGKSGFSGDKGPAVSAQLNFGGGLGYGALAVDSGGNLYISDTGNQRIRKVSNGVITTIAGNGAGGFDGAFGGDNGPAISASLSLPFGVAVDAAGNVYIVDKKNARVREVSNGVITTIAGGGVAIPGDNGPATSAALRPVSIALDPAGNLYVTGDDERVRKISNGNIATVAGNGTAGSCCDNGPATNEWLQLQGGGIAVDAASNIYILDAGRVRKISHGIISTVAGNGGYFINDNGPPTNAELRFLTDYSASATAIALDSSGNLYIADTQTHRIRKVSNSLITTVAGNNPGFAGDNGPANSAELQNPTGVALDAAGNFYILDAGNNRIRKVSNGVITTVAGNGQCCFSPDGILATSAWINPHGIAVDPDGTLYISDWGSVDVPPPAPFGSQSRVRKVSDGSITTVAGTGTDGFSGDNGPATNAQLREPAGLALDSAGNLYIADGGNHRIRELSKGVITTVAGNGQTGFSGDGGPATSAQGLFADAIATDFAGNLYVTDLDRVRVISKGVINTIAGNGTNGFSGDNGRAIAAQLNAPSGLAVDSAGSVYIADSGNERVRILTLPFVGKNSASYVADSLAPDTIAITEASGIAAGLITAPDGAWPTSLGGVSLEITDSQGAKRLAPIGSVSTNSITYVIPADTALGLASVKLTTFVGIVIPGQIQIVRVSPGLYSANANGSGVAAGMWIRVAPDNFQTTGYLFEPSLPVGNRYAIALDPGPEGDRVFLALYGTGFHNASQVIASAGGVSIPVVGMAPAGASEGEDVVTIGPLPREFLGPEIPLALTFDGQPANTVLFSIRAPRSRPAARLPSVSMGRRLP